jgi:hypothetical protein
MGAALTKSNALSYLPLDVPLIYHKRMMTCHHTAIGGVTPAVCRFVHFTWWRDVISYSPLMTSNFLPPTLQTALLDMYGALQGGYFEL